MLSPCLVDTPRGRRVLANITHKFPKQPRTSTTWSIDRHAVVINRCHLHIWRSLSAKCYWDRATIRRSLSSAQSSLASTVCTVPRAEVQMLSFQNVTIALGICTSDRESSFLPQFAELFWDVCRIPLTSPLFSLAFLQGRKSGSVAVLLRRFLECRSGLLGLQFSLSAVGSAGPWRCAPRSRTSSVDCVATDGTSETVELVVSMGSSVCGVFSVTPGLSQCPLFSLCSLAEW